VLGEVSGAHQLHARQSNVELFRDAGIDMALYRDEPGIRVDVSLGNSRDRGGHGRHATGGVDTPIEECCMYRDFDYLDKTSLDAARAQAKPGVFIFNCWVEAWGKHEWFQPEPGDANVAALAVMDGKKAEGLLRINSTYPADAFWWDSQSRITPAFPGGPHYLEPFAHAVAELDACRITRGGLFLDKAHTEATRQFAGAYRALPDETFETVGATTDPVAVRTLLHDGSRYVYLVNRDYYPVDIALTFDSAPNPVRDLASGKDCEAAQRWSLTLGPYELRVFTVIAKSNLTGFVASPPAAIVAQLTSDAHAALRAIAETRARGYAVPGMDVLESGLTSALAEGRLAWVRRALTSYIVRKCAALAGAKA
jgi:hypothetical protein